MLLILACLLDGERHGYAIMQGVQALTEGETRLGPGTLYGAIKRLLQAKLIVESTARPADDDERRRYYRITPLGRAAVEAEARRMRRLVALVGAHGRTP